MRYAIVGTCPHCGRGMETEGYSASLEANTPGAWLGLTIYTCLAMAAGFYLALIVVA